MNVAARLCDYCKSIEERLVVSGDLMRLIGTPPGLAAAHRGLVTVRGRQEAVETWVIHNQG